MDVLNEHIIIIIFLFFKNYYEYEYGMLVYGKTLVKIVVYFVIKNQIDGYKQ